MEIDKDAFKKHLEEASRIVASWPEWKRKVLWRIYTNG